MLTDFPNGATSFGVPLPGPIDVGNIYWVKQTTASDYAVFSQNHSTDYDDGTNSMQTDIQSALNACTSGRNDYVIVMPDATDYTPATTLTMSKNNVHLICPSGLGSEYGCATRGATIGQATAAGDTISVAARGCEVAGFWIRGGTDHLCVSLTSAATGASVHNNDCAIYSSSTGSGGIAAAGAAGAKIERNKVFTNSGVSKVILYGIYADGPSTRLAINKNLVLCSNSCTMTVGISNSGVMGTICGNVLSNCATAGATNPGTITTFITIGAATSSDGYNAKDTAGTVTYA